MVKKALWRQGLLPSKPRRGCLSGANCFGVMSVSRLTRLFNDRQGHVSVTHKLTNHERHGGKKSGTRMFYLFLPTRLMNTTIFTITIIINYWTTWSNKSHCARFPLELTLWGQISGPCFFLHRRRYPTYTYSSVEVFGMTQYGHSLWDM